VPLLHSQNKVHAAEKVSSNREQKVIQIAAVVKAFSRFLNAPETHSVPRLHRKVFLQRDLYLNG